MKKEFIDKEDEDYIYKDWIRLTYEINDSSSEVNLFTTTPNHDLDGSECELFDIEKVEDIVIKEIGHISPTKTYKFDDEGRHKVFVKLKDMTILPFSAFVDCKELSSVELPSSIVLIEGFAFDGCVNLRSVFIDTNIGIIENYAFRNCESLGFLWISAEIAPEIEENTFEGVNPDCELHIFKDATGYDEW